MEDPHARQFIHVVRKLVLTVGKRPQSLVTGTSPLRCLSVLTTWQLVSLKTSDIREV